MVDKNIVLNSRIMIVDDLAANAILLERVLQQAGYQHYTTVTDSRQVLERFRVFQPDLLLLDLMMPNMDGYAVMTQLRGWLPTEEYLPVLVITADASRKAKEKALSHGAKDFLTKPIDTTEATLRVYNLLETRWLYRQIRQKNQLLLEHNDRLEATVQDRTRDLTEAHRRLSLLDDAKSAFLALISHELRTPLNGLLGAGELLLDQMPRTADDDGLREMFEHSRRRVLSLTDKALLLTQLELQPEKFQMTETDLSDVLACALEEAGALAAERSVRLPARPAHAGSVVGNKKLLIAAFRALLESAIRFSRENGCVTITHAASAGGLDLRIHSSEGTLSDSDRKQFFDVFAISESKTTGGDLGLGPHVAHRAISLSGGSLEVANCRPSGIELRASFPRAGAAVSPQEERVLMNAGG